MTDLQKLQKMKDNNWKPAVQYYQEILQGQEGKVAENIIKELRKAQLKFPGKNTTFAALVEEVGELAKALMEEPKERVVAEAQQVAVMAMRIILEGDHSYDEWRKLHNLDSITPDFAK